MKKVLFATTALVMTAGFASAEVSISGSAEMGVIDRGTATSQLEFMQSVDVRFRMSGETDNGLTFGAVIDLDDSQDTAVAGRDTVDSTTFSDFTVFIGGDFGNLTMGDTDGAMDWGLSEGNSILPGDISDASSSFAGYAGGSYLDGAYDGQIVRYDNTFGDFGVAVSMELDDTGVRDAGYAIGAKYSIGDIALGLGYQKTDVADMTGISAAYSANGFSGVLMYSTGSNGTVDVTNIHLGLGYAMDAFSVGLVLAQNETGATTTDGWGLAAGYDLGGGAKVLAGLNSDEMLSLGVSMSF